MKKKLNVLFMPKWDQANPYQRLLLEQFDPRYVETNIVNYKKGVFRISSAAWYYRRKHKKNILHLHWLSPIFMEISWSKNPLIFSIKYLILYCDLLLCKFYGFKIVWTIHNKLAHEGNNKSNEIILRRLVFRIASNVIVHSEEALDALSELYNLPVKDKATVIKHGNYIGVYPPPSDNRLSLRESLNYSANQKVFLFFGAIKRYKGVEAFIEISNLFSGDNHYLFVIAGKVETEEYAQTLRNSISSKNIVFIARFLEGQDLVDIIHSADAIILPFTDTLASGSMLLSMSLGKAVFLPENGRIFGCVEGDYELFFDSIEELITKIKTFDINTLTRIGKRNLELAKKNDWEAVGKSTLDIYLSE